MHIKDLIRIFAAFSVLLTSLVSAQQQNEGELIESEHEYSANSGQSGAVKSQYQCELRGNVRRVEVQYSDTTAAVPCSVLYYKDTEAPSVERVLWRASNEEGYCEAKAQDFVEKLQNWGWSCK